MKISKGIYEQIINQAVEDDLRQIESTENLTVEKKPIDNAEAQHILAVYMAKVIEKSLSRIFEENNVDSKAEQIKLCNDLISKLYETSKSKDWLECKIDNGGEQLLAVFQRSDEELKKKRPQTSLAISTLFTGSKTEPSMVGELKREIATADRIDMLVSFIKWSGLRLIIDDLKDFLEKDGHCLRIITTSYMGATDPKALEELASLPNTEIKVSYDKEKTRLHAKAYMFYRSSGFSTAYIGSSNLSSAAIGDGLEWNVKATNQDLPHIIKNIGATFDSYWNSADFEDFHKEDFSKFEKAIKNERTNNTLSDEIIFRIEPYAYQREILERLKAEREIYGHYKNLVVAATGTGKTVISAFDYKEFRKQSPQSKNRLLFVAHRQEILKQSLKTFRGILKDYNFGDVLYGGQTPSQKDHLFISVQSFNSQDFCGKFPPDFYDYIVIDEVHHASAASYQKLLSHFTPKVLLGLTATPERMDGFDILSYFDNRIAAEIRLPEAINRELLVPFQYFGVTDPVDLSSVTFTRGYYDMTELENVYIRDDARTANIISSVRKYVTSVNDVVGLGFCVSVEHAKYMSRRFNEAGIASSVLYGASTENERSTVKDDLVNKRIHFIFTVDLYNEGVDIPEVNTILFLRPTESLTVFIQQLGRGLRTCEGKHLLTVLDFIGQQHQKYSFTFESKFRALFDKTQNSLKDEAENGFTHLPAGCNIVLEKVAMQYVLENIKQAIPNKRNIISLLSSFEKETGENLTLTTFLRKYPYYTLKDIYKADTFTSLKMQAGLIPQKNLPNMEIFKKAFQRLCEVNDREWLSALVSFVKDGNEPLSFKERCHLNMLHYSFFQESPIKMGWKKNGIIDFIKSEPELCDELIDFLQLRYASLSFVSYPLTVPYGTGLQTHCSYTRDQILAGFGYWNEKERPEMREGVLYLKDKKTYLLFIDLNKSEKDFSPTTMYNDYAINETLFHWQSQSTTSEKSTRGQAYINHKQNGEKIILFVREQKKNRYGTLPYVCLGTADFVSSTGEKPMNIIWKLDREIPADLYKVAAQAIAV